MTLYFDAKVQFLDPDAISTTGKWHKKEPLFAMASYSTDHGGSVTIFDDTGEPVRNLTYPVHPTSQATALCWHPDKKLLVTAWENGELHSWYDGNREFSAVQGPHRAPIVLLEFSEQGGRMVTADSMGLLTGWRCDGQYQFLTMFSHELRVTMTCITFRQTVLNPLNAEISSLAKAAVAGDETALDTLTNWRPRTAARSLSHAGIRDNHCFYIGTQSGIVLFLNQSGSCTEILKENASSITEILWHPKREAVVILMEDMSVCHYSADSSGMLKELDKVKLSGKVPGNNGAISWAGNAVAIITGDFSIRIWDMDTSDNYLLNMSLPTSSAAGRIASNDKQQLGIGKTLMSSNSSGAVVGISGRFSGIGGETARSGQTIEIFTCIAYCRDNQTLCAGTNQGNLYTWKRTTNYLIDVPENAWQLNNVSAVQDAIKQCYWGVNEIAKPCVLVNCISNVYVLKEQPLILFHTRDIWAIQRSANQIYVEHSCGKSGNVHADISITNLSLTETNLILSNSRTIVTYKISKDDEKLLMGNDTDSGSLSIRTLQSFSAECLALFIFGHNILCLTTSDVKIYSLGGVILKEIVCNDNEGKPIGCDLTNQYLTLFTMNGYIKIYDVSRHEPKILIHSKSGYDLFENFGEIIIAKCNAMGTHLGLVIANESLIPDGKLYVWDFENDILGSKDFLRKPENEDNKSDNFVSRLPITFHWDADDKRLLAIEARSLQQQNADLNNSDGLTSKKNSSQPFVGSYQKHTPAQQVSSMGQKRLAGASAGTSVSALASAKGQSPGLMGSTESLVFVMFATDKCYIKELETVNLAPGEQLVNLCAPHVVTLKINAVKLVPLRNFTGLENCEPETRQKILDFSLSVAEGNMDLAFRSIRSIQSEVVWTNLAKMCIHTERLDVARVCFGHLRRARSVRALRDAIENRFIPNDAKVAVLAIELGMLTEAEDLYRKCERYDLLNKLLTARGKLDEAILIAEKKDRLNLRHLYWQKGHLLEEQGDIKGALSYFEKCDGHTQCIVKLLRKYPPMLKEYMERTTDLENLKWWGQFIESTGDMEAAFKIYQKADDYYSQVRILCFLNQIPRAESIAKQNDSKPGYFHLGKHFEKIGNIPEAIHYFTKSTSYFNSARICREQDLPDDLWTVAQLAENPDKFQAAEYFEENGAHKRAVELYHKCGQIHKAVELAFATQQPDILQVIAQELDSSSEPELIKRCAEFFTSVEQHQKAVHLLARTKQFELAMEICVEKTVPVTEELCEMLTPEKDEMQEEARTKHLMQLGEILQGQGDYHTATKKFTQAGDQVRAMKSLLKSSDTDKIVFFAGVSRQRDVYIMAANYLQALNWKDDPKILKNIITFYSKGQAFDSLANFHATCSQIEINEAHNYEKALTSMQEAGKCLAKVPNSQRAADNLQETIAEVKRVLDLKEALENGEYQTVIAGCRLMLAKPEKLPVRQSDIVAMLIQGLAAAQLYSEAYGYLRELSEKEPFWSAKGFLDKTLVQEICEKCAIDFQSVWNSGKRRQSSTEHTDENEEEIAEELE